ncbi:MAG: SIS domain-containing protein [Thiobacillus sp.]
MPLQDRILGHFQASAQATLDAAGQLAPLIDEGSALILNCLTQGGKILACGNGASAASAQIFAALMVNRLEHERPGLAAIALAADTSMLTSIADDHGYDQVFARQIKALGLPGDVLLLLTDGANQAGMLGAVDAAHARGMNVIAMAGRDGGAMAEQMREVDVLMCVPAETDARIHEIHLLSLHCLCDAVDSILLGVE